MKTARLVVIGVALAAGLGAAYIVMDSKPPEPVRVVVPAAPVETDAVLVAARDIGFGAVITADDMRWQPWPKGQMPQGIIEKSLRPNAFDEIKGSIVRSNFLAGEPFRPDRLVKGTGSGFLSAVLPSGARAVAINIDEKGTTTAGGFILPNDRVDVVRTFHAEDGAPGSFASETILTNIRVLAIGQSVQEKSGERVVAGGTATLELTPEQAERVILAQRTSQLSLTLRSMADSAQEVVAPTIIAQPPSMTIVRFGNASQARVR
ncbi:Flp pilus assembly protein CpaB [Beijerinckia sp. L45]|uniref:Flp pilus assembly protein CpaB n=1 Tax=Beijerinckia sp. L45 TaxID=1641855 RepID=UPI00131D959D|nr:Flp pilus assembly protein CpaB [Beijerinckia sp. L45]